MNVIIPAERGAAEAITCRMMDVAELDDAARIDKFLAETPAASYMQRSFWPKLAPRTVLQRFAYLVCETPREVVLAGVVRLTRLAIGRALATFPRGPIFRSATDLDRCLPEMMSVLRRSGVCTVMV